jgi:hypothetical protein
MTGQTKTHSIVESIINILIGYGIAITAQLYIFPLYGIHISLSQNMQISLWFTIISIIRSYCIRRWFNKIMLKMWQKKRGKTNGISPA